MKTKVIKSFALEVKDMNDSTGEVTFQFASFTKDLDNEIIERGAYSKTVSESIKNIYHNRDHKDAVGKPQKIFVEDNGAFCISKLALKTINGMDCYEQYKAGLIKGHSQEFMTIKDSYSQEKKARVIKELKLWGVTSVTDIPANLDTPTLSLKSFDDIARQMEKINNLLHNGNASDEICEAFCVQYKKMAEFMKSKSALLKQLGVVHCANCQQVMDTKNIPEDQMYGKCPSCGRFVNKGNGELKPPHMIITPSMVSGFKL